MTARPASLPVALPVVALVSATQSRRIREALEPDFRVHRVRTWEALQVAAASQRPCAIFVGPTVHGAFDIAALATVTRETGAGCVNLYAPLRRPVMSSMAGIQLLGITTLLVEGFEDSTHRIQQVTEDIASRAVSRRLLSFLPDATGGIDVQLRAAIEQLVRYPRRFTVADDLASAARVSLRTLYRRFGELQLASPRVLVAAARILRAHWHMRELGVPPSVAARRLRYASRDALARQTESFLEMSPKVASMRLSSREVATHLARQILEGSRAAPPGEREKGESSGFSHASHDLRRRRTRAWRSRAGASNVYRAEEVDSIIPSLEHPAT